MSHLFKSVSRHARTVLLYTSIQLLITFAHILPGFGLRCVISKITENFCTYTAQCPSTFLRFELNRADLTDIKVRLEQYILKWVVKSFTLTLDIVCFTNVEHISWQYLPMCPS